jgi:hypothetical protein
MDETQRKAIGGAALVIALILFAFYFGRPFWDWATWNESKGTLDFGIFKVTTRPPFPSDAKAVGLGLILPVALVALGRVLGFAKRKSS